MPFRPLHPLFAAELMGGDLSEPPSPGMVQMIEEGMARYGVMVIRNADISDEQHLAFSRAFGPLEFPSRRKEAPLPPAEPLVSSRMFHAGNLDKNGNILPYNSDGLKLAKGAERFHTDSSFHAMPTKWSLLRGVETPPPSVGGDTLFADVRAAYDDLDEATKAQIEGLNGIHDFWEGRRQAGFTGDVTPELRALIPFDPVEHPLVRTMPGGRKALFVGGHCVGIAGMDPAEGRELVDKLYVHATQDKYVYRHHWRQHDMLIWDNRCTMHAATPLLSDEYRRDMRRTTINESGPECSAFEWLGLSPS